MSYIFARPVEVRALETSPNLSAIKKEEKFQGKTYSTSNPISEPSSSWASFLKKTFDSISSDEAKFGAGFGAGLAITSITALYQFSASSLEWIPSMKSMTIEAFRKQGVPIALDATCPYTDYEAMINPNGILSSYRDLSVYEALSQGSKMLQMLATPFNILMGIPSSAKHTTTSLKLLPVGMVLEGAVMEELVWRGLFQDVLLKRLPQMLIKVVMPGKEELLDTKVAKIFRIITTAALFSTTHLANKQLMSNDYVEKLQIPVTFVAGLVFGAIKESKLGLTGAIGAHMGMNISASVPNFLMC